MPTVRFAAWLHARVRRHRQRLPLAQLVRQQKAHHQYHHTDPDSPASHLYQRGSTCGLQQTQPQCFHRHRHNDDHLANQEDESSRSQAHSLSPQDPARLPRPWRHHLKHHRIRPVSAPSSHAHPARGLPAARTARSQAAGVSTTAEVTHAIVANTETTGITANDVAVESVDAAQHRTAHASFSATSRIRPRRPM